MNGIINAKDLWYLIIKLPRDEQIRLAKLSLYAATTSNVAHNDISSYINIPMESNEYLEKEDLLAWDAEGWEEFYASR